MDDLRAAEVDFLTIGQYLQPTPKHHPVARFVDARRSSTAIAGMARGKGFLMVSASPLTRSSYHAGDDFAAAAGAPAPRALAATPRPMPTHAEQRVCPTRRSSSSTLVADVERYPEFLPWCVGARIRERRERRVLRRPDHRLQDVPRAVQVARDAGPADRDRRRLYRRAVPISQQPLALRPAPGGCRGRFLRRLRVQVAHPADASSACCSTRRCAAWSPPSRAARGSSTVPRNPIQRANPRYRSASSSRGAQIGTACRDRLLPSFRRKQFQGCDQRRSANVGAVPGKTGARRGRRRPCARCQGKRGRSASGRAAAGTGNPGDRQRRDRPRRA